MSPLRADLLEEFTCTNESGAVHVAIDVPIGLRVKGPSEATPPRQSGSVRRTSTIDMRWPDGWGKQLRLTGRARDLLTPADGGQPIVLAEDQLDVGVAPDRTIQEISANPPRSAVAGLVGLRGGSGSRGRIAELLASEKEAGTPLYLLLDDIPGATLIAGFAFSSWMSPEMRLELMEKNGSLPKRRMEGVCTGFQPGSSGLTPDGSSRFTHQVKPVQPLDRTDDPEGWHPLNDIAEISMRRARLIDVHLDEVVTIDSMFQDSSTTPDGGRIAVHEYRVEATADPLTGELLTLHADPRVLPYNECPLASANVGRLVGTPLRDLRSVVLEQLPGTEGCTHLNDAMRALAEVPVMVESLRQLD